MTGSALAADAVAIRQVRARGVAEAALRRQLDAVPTPRLRRFVFIRRVTLRAGPDRVGQAMQAALAQLAEGDRAEVLSFADFPALAVACARAAIGGGLAGWHWRLLGLPRLASPGEAIGALLAAHPREAGSAVAALAAQGLLPPVWRDLPDTVATRLTAALAQAAGVALPAWPEASDVPRPPPGPAVALLARAAAFWAPVLAPLPPGHPAIMTAAVLSLLRWSPSVLRTPTDPVWPALLAGIAHPAPAAPAPVRRHPAEPLGAPAAPAPWPVPPDPPRPLARPAPVPAAPAAPPVPAPEDPGLALPPHGVTLATGWGGVLFLVNALRRLQVEALLAASGPAAPTGWRLLHALGSALGLPEEEPIARFLAAQDLDTAVPPELLARLLDGLDALYRAEGPWPLPLAQHAVLRATETHLDLDLAATSVDLALRLSGLDLDPGWVAWLGRVVTFHYDSMPTQLRRDAIPTQLRRDAMPTQLRRDTIQTQLRRDA